MSRFEKLFLACGLLLLPSLAPTLSGQAVGKKANSDSAKPQVKSGDRKQKKIQKKPKWPYLKYVRKDIAKKKIPQLAAKKAERRREAEKLLLSYGPGVCPLLMKAMHDKQKPEVAAALQSLLEQLTRKEHAPLLVAAWKPSKKRLSRWLVKRLDSFESKSLRPFFAKALKAKDFVVRESAQFALARLGSVDTLPFLLRLASDDWVARNVEIRSVLPSLRGETATKDLVSRLNTTENKKTRVGCLRLLGGAGTKKAVPSIADMLNSPDNQIRIEAVNALRVIVDGKRPFAKLSVFNAITEVKAWKRRLGR